MSLIRYLASINEPPTGASARNGAPLSHPAGEPAAGANAGEWPAQRAA